MESIESKQALLRHEVLEGGLNAEEFIEYLGEIRNEGTLEYRQGKTWIWRIGP